MPSPSGSLRPRVLLRVELPPHNLEELRAGAPAVEFVVAATPGEWSRELPQADAIIGGGALSDEELARATKLRWMAATSAGVEQLVTPALRQKCERDGMVLTNFRGVAAPNIAEHVLAMMFAFARGLPTLFQIQMLAAWPTEKSAPPTFELDGQTLLIVGLGEIGRALAPKAHALGLRVLATERSPHDAPEGVELRAENELADLLWQAHHVVLCLPLTDETRGSFATEQFSQMRAGSYFYNIGRGGLADQNALIAALQSKHLAGAGLDVTDPEPLPTDSLLWTLPNVILTGHTAGSTPQYWERGTQLLLENTRRFAQNEELRDIVNINAGY